MKKALFLAITVLGIMKILEPKEILPNKTFIFISPTTGESYKMIELEKECIK